MSFAKGSDSLALVMSNSAREIEKVTSGLTKAWEFLSGERRQFECSMVPIETPDFAEFSFFMSLALHDTGKNGGVGVFIQRDDAISVAAHMFAEERHLVDEHELRDACAEVGNVCANNMAAHFSGGQKISIGLPRAVSAAEYQQLVDTSTVRAIYRGCVGTPPSSFVLFDGLNSLAHHRFDK